MLENFTYFCTFFSKKTSIVKSAEENSYTRTDTPGKSNGDPHELPMLIEGPTFVSSVENFQFRGFFKRLEILAEILNS